MKIQNNIKNKSRKTLSTIPFFILLVFFTGITSRSTAQQITPTVICTAGETFVTPTQSIEFALGEVAVETFQAGGNILSQGFLQGAQKGIGINEDLLNNSNIRVFPNPSNGVLTVRCENAPERILLLDLQGKTVYKIEKPGKTATVDIKEFRSGMYLIRIIFKNSLPLTKRIIKN